MPPPPQVWPSGHLPHWTVAAAVADRAALRADLRAGLRLHTAPQTPGPPPPPPHVWPAGQLPH